MGHRGNIEARHTTNKGMYYGILIQEMCELFQRSEIHLDI